MCKRSPFWTMIVVVIGIAVTVWGIPLAGLAAQPVTRTQGTLASVDTAGMTMTLNTSAGPQAFSITRTTVVHVGDEYTQSFSALTPFVGAEAIVLSTEVGGSQVAGRVDVLVFPATGVVGLNPGADSGNGQRGGALGAGINTGGTISGTTNTASTNTGGGTSGGGGDHGGGKDGGKDRGGDHDGGKDGGKDRGGDHDGGKDGGKDRGGDRAGGDDGHDGGNGPR